MGFWATVLLGVVGSFVGGFLGYVLFGKDLDEGALQASGIIGSILGRGGRACLLYRLMSPARLQAASRLDMTEGTPARRISPPSAGGARSGAPSARRRTTT